MTETVARPGAGGPATRGTAARIVDGVKVYG